MNGRVKVNGPAKVDGHLSQSECSWTEGKVFWAKPHGQESKWTVTRMTLNEEDRPLLKFLDWPVWCMIVRFYTFGNSSVSLSDRPLYTRLNKITVMQCHMPLVWSFYRWVKTEVHCECRLLNHLLISIFLKVILCILCFKQKLTRNSQTVSTKGFA